MPSTTTDPTSAAAARPAHEATAEVRMRMYNVGFGDAFLLFLPTPEGERTMLVDCGAHMSGIANPTKAIVADIIEAVTHNGRSRIDVVVASHRHYDHISGFAVPGWDQVEVGEVWLPWTEERGNPAADDLRTKQHRLALQLTQRFAADTDIGWLALNSLSNEDAETTLLEGFKNKRDAPRRYLPSVDRSEATFETPVLPGVRIHALGPSHDPDVVAQMDPPAGKGFPFGFDIDGPVPERPPLFHTRYLRTPEEYAGEHPTLAARAGIDDVTKLVAFDYLAAASNLEDAINGTSLVLVLEVGRHRILLAGDAEWGTWSVVLDDPAWRELLARTTVYKVAHHGSWNGTPKPFVDELLPDDAVSLMSFKKVKKWPSIPRASLVDALEDQQRTLLRSDQDHTAGAITGAGGPGGTITTGDLWIQVNLPL